MKNPLDLSEIKENSVAQEFFREQQRKVYRNTSRLFAILMPLQWLASVIIAWFVAPLSWKGADSEIHPHIWEALLIGGAITLLPVFLALKYPEEKITRYTVAVGQMLMSGLLIHLTGGRIETHFHVFGSLAFLSFYRDWKIFIPATLITLIDHIFRGWFYPQSIYGILTGGEWRWLEHAAWVSFENIFLIASCRYSVSEMKETAAHAAALSSSQSRYQTVIEQMSEGVFLVEPETFQIIECNPEFAKILGYESIEQAKSLNLMDFVTDDRQTIEKRADNLIKNPNSLKGERTYRRRNGSLVEVEITGRYISYNSGNVFCVNIKDITERKRAELEIKKLALVAQKTENSVMILSQDGEIKWANEGFTRISGYLPEEVIGKNAGDCFSGEKTSPETIAAMTDAMINWRSFHDEIFTYGKDRKGHWITISLTPYTDSKGNPEGFIAMGMDIMERKKMEADLIKAHEDLEFRVARRTSELIEVNKKMADEVCERTRIENQLGTIRKFLLNVIDNVPNLIFVKDFEGKFTLANRSLAELYGVDVKDLIGKTDIDFAPNREEAEKFQKDDREIIENWQEKVIFEEKITDVKGNVHWLHTVKRPLFDGSGVKSILGISTDMTERKILEGQLHHAQKLESIGQLAAGIAHEINTPTQYVGDNTRFIRDAFTDVNAILEKYRELFDAAQKGAVNDELLRDLEEEIEQADLEYLVEEVPKAIRQSLEGVSRIADIVQSMKDFAHPGSGAKKLANINKAIKSTITVARNEWKYVADIETYFDNSLPPVPCLLGEFNQVILNMVINASHAISDVVGDGSNGKGKITVTTTRVNDDWAEIRIADTGKGISNEDQKRIFEPFFTTKEVGKGTGQGLAISHTVIVEKHNGKLKFESEPGKGTTFIIQLPLDSGENAKEKMTK